MNPNSQSQHSSALGLCSCPYFGGMVLQGQAQKDTCAWWCWPPTSVSRLFQVGLTPCRIPVQLKEDLTFLQSWLEV